MITRTFNHSAWFQINQVSNTSTSLKNSSLYICQMAQIIQIIKKVLSLNYSSTFEMWIP